jgi:hypothetical protein
METAGLRGPIAGINKMESKKQIHLEEMVREKNDILFTASKKGSIWDKKFLFRCKRLDFAVFGGDGKWAEGIKKPEFDQ